MNPAVTTDHYFGFPYNNLNDITGTETNRVHWYDYKPDVNNAEIILDTFIFDGNNCKVKILKSIKLRLFYSMQHSS